MEHKAHIKEELERGVKDMVTQVVKVIAIIILGIVLVFIMGYAVQHLWNWLMPDLFGLPTVGYWKALGILVLSKIIFGFGGGNHKKTKTKGEQKKKRRSLKQDLSKWKYYEEFWESEGETAYEAFKKRKEEE